MQTNPADMSALITAIQQMHGGAEIINQPSPDDPASLPLLVLPQGKSFTELNPLLEKYLPRPRFLKEKAQLFSTQALIDYAKRFSTGDSALFVNGNPTAPWLRLIVDYHVPTITSDSFGYPEPAHCFHTGTYSFPLSDEVKAWRTAQDGGLMEGEDFAWFLDRHLNDIANPPVNWMMIPQEELDRLCAILNLRDDHQPRDAQGNPIPFDQLDRDLEREEEELPTGYRTKLDKLRAKRFGTQQQLLTLSQEMSIRTEGKTKQSFSLQDGSRVMEFAEDHEANVRGRKVKVPDLFLIEIPLFDAEETRLMPVRLFYRKAGAGVKWAIELVDHRRMLKTAVADAAARVAQETGLPLFNGDPKSA